MMKAWLKSTQDKWRGKQAMKKIVSIIITFAIILSTLTGCQLNNKGNNDMIEDGAVYKIVSINSGRVIQGQNFCNLEGSLMEQATYTGELNQLWRAQIQEDGTFCFESVAVSERYLSVKKASKDTGANISVNLLNNEKLGQIWKLDNIEDGSCVIRSIHSDKVLQAKDGGKADGVVITQEEYVKGTDIQKWRFEKVADKGEEIPSLLPVSGAIEHSSCPAIIRYGDKYYMYIMAPGISIKMSTDLINWTYVQTAFPTSGSGLPYSWMNEEIPGGGIWAPSVYKIGDLYYLYYCISTSGSQNSAIGVAVNTTLDHTSPDFKWEDKGMVLRSKTGDSFNAIDPNVIIDDDGQAWLVFGSWWTGIKMRRLDNTTGKLDTNDTKVYNLARYTADSSKNSIEAPCMIKHGDYYYLFAAFDRMDNGTYNSRVGRSKSVTGPFLDKSGKDMMKGGGTQVSQGKDGIDIPAHASIFKDTDGQYYFVSEYFQEYGKTSSQHLISTIVWDEEGWPATALTPRLFDAN